MPSRRPALLVLGALSITACFSIACSDGAADEAGGGGGGGTSSTGVGGTGASTFNQCGVAAPLPADTGQCTLVSAPLITDFDDYTGTTASSYTFYVNGKPPAPDSLLGAILHVDDGSAANGGTAVVTTEMVTGVGDAGYALEVADTNAMTWGGLLMLYLPYSGATAACMDGSNYAGLEFSIRGSSPSGRFGVVLGMLDTVPIADHGLCSNAATTDCKDATIELTLPADAATWTDVRLPWSAFTPGVGTGTSCIPVTGQNILRIVIQPFMSYPPPDYMFQPGAYALAVDNVRFF